MMTLIQHNIKTASWMIRLLLMSVTICLSASYTFAQDDNSPQRYNVSYWQDHAFIRQDEDFTVIDTKMEWPESVDFVDISPLQQKICGWLFDEQTTSVDTAYRSFKQRYGQPVSGKLSQLPDDRHFCYVTNVVRLVDYEPQRWITFQVAQKVRPQSLYPDTARSFYRLVTYDLTNERVMLTEDLLRQGRISDIDEEGYYTLFSKLSDDDFYGLTSANVDGIWFDLKRQSIGFHIICTTKQKTFVYTNLLPYEDASYLLSHDAIRMWKGKEPKQKRQPVFTTLPGEWKGDTVYRIVDQMPAFAGGQDSLRSYMSSVAPPVLTADNANRHGTVIVAFVVCKDGMVDDVHVVQPVSPEIDRHAVSLMKSMPKWTPGYLDGKACVVRLFLPLRY